MIFGLWNKKSTGGEGKPSVATVLTRNWSLLKGKLSPRRDQQLPDISRPQTAQETLKAIIAERPLQYHRGESKPSVATVAESRWSSLKGGLSRRRDQQVLDTRRRQNAQDYLKAVIAKRPLEYPRGESKPSVATVAEGKGSSLKGEGSPQREEQPPTRPPQNIQDALRDRLRGPRSGALSSHVLTVRATSPLGWSSRLGDKAGFSSHPRNQLSSKLKRDEACSSGLRSSEPWLESAPEFNRSPMGAEGRNVAGRKNSAITTKVEESRRAEVGYGSSTVVLPPVSPSMSRKTSAVVEGSRTTSVCPPVPRCAPNLRVASSKPLGGFRKEVRSGQPGHCQSHPRSSGTALYAPPREGAIHRTVNRPNPVPISLVEEPKLSRMRDMSSQYVYRPRARTTSQTFTVSRRPSVGRIEETQLPRLRPAPSSSLRTSRSGPFEREDVSVALPAKQTAVHLPRGNDEPNDDGEGYESSGSTDSNDSDRTIRPSRISFSSQCTGHNGKASYRPCTERTRPPMTLRRGPQQPHLGLCYHTPQVSETEIRRGDSRDRSNIGASRQADLSARDIWELQYRLEICAATGDQKSYAAATQEALGAGFVICPNNVLRRASAIMPGDAAFLFNNG